MDRVEVVREDITRLDVEAIVNAANSALSGGGGVDGVIHRAAGPELLAECRRIGRCPTGAAVITPGYRLCAKYVIHAVGPVWRGGDHREDELLASCYQQAIGIAEAHGIQSIAFPAISCGAYGYPIDRAARVAIDALRAALPASLSLQRVLLAAYNRQVAAAWEKELERQRAG